MGTQGDSFFVVFPTADDAVAAAIQAQQALASASWPAGAALRARMGIHTGSPTRHGQDLVGLDVHVAARVASAAHGGQVLLSGASAALLRDGSARARLRSLGAHRLKGIQGDLASSSR